MILKVEYMNQRAPEDGGESFNILFPGSTCGSTVFTMMLQYLNDQYGEEFTVDTDSFFLELQKDYIVEKLKAHCVANPDDNWMLDFAKPTRTDNFGNTYNHLNNLPICLSWAAQGITNDKYTFPWAYRTFAEINRQIDNLLMPVAVSGLFTKSGHYTLIVGHEDAESYIFNDPYGNWNANVNPYASIDGKGVRYLLKDLIPAVWNSDRLVNGKLLCAVPVKA